MGAPLVGFGGRVKHHTARRAEWFEARDAWIARQREWAPTHGTDGEDSGG